LINTVVLTRGLQKRRKDEEIQMTMFSAVSPLTDLCLPPITKDAEYLSPLSSSSFYFSFGFRCPLPFQFSCLRFTRPCDPHTALLLQWSVVPLSARSRAKYIFSCSFSTTNKDIQVTSSSQSDLRRGLCSPVGERTLLCQVSILDSRAIGGIM